eukprot:1134617-Amphidinium_carterae.1
MRSSGLPVCTTQRRKHIDSCAKCTLVQPMCYCQSVWFLARWFLFHGNVFSNHSLPNIPCAGCKLYPSLLLASCSSLLAEQGHGYVTV